MRSTYIRICNECIRVYEEYNILGLFKGCIVSPPNLFLKGHGKNHSGWPRTGFRNHAVGVAGLDTPRGLTTSLHNGVLAN